MPLIKIGRTCYNDEERPVYLLQGTATKDAEWAPVNDKPHAKVSVAAGYTENGEPVYVNLNGWRDRADQVYHIIKLDSVLAVGVLKKREYQGKLYFDLDADFVAISGVGLNGFARDDAPAPKKTKASAADVDASDFEDLGDVDDGDLPF